jgi:hypothetical protein
VYLSNPVLPDALDSTPVPRVTVTVAVDASLVKLVDESSPASSDGERSNLRRRVTIVT